MKLIINGESVDIGGGPGSSTQAESLPIGSVIMWTGTLETIPTGWHLCDGTDGTFDLCGMFILGAGGAYNLGDSGGSEEVTLTVEQMPQHNHVIYGSGGTWERNGINATVKPISSAAQTQSTNTGSSQPHPNMPPYKALYYIQKIA